VKLCDEMGAERLKKSLPKVKNQKGEESEKENF
jgi:hypothetical protein